MQIDMTEKRDWRKGFAVFAAIVMLACVATEAFAENGCWTRVRFQKTNGGDMLQLSEFALYDWQGAMVNRSLTAVADGTAATDLSAGQATGYVAGGLNGSAGTAFNTAGENLACLFDNSTGTKLYRKANVSLDPGTESTWIVITMRLAANAKPIAYNLATANDLPGSRSPTHWIVECSTNGVDWTIADTRENVAWPTTTFTWWNGGVNYPLAVDWAAFRVSYAQREVYYAASSTPKPVPTVVSVADPSVTLTEGVDYMVSYENWDRLGNATATVTGIGAYESSENKYRYMVVPAFEAELSNAVVTNDLVHPYLPAVIVRSVATHATLTENVHYRLEYVAPSGFGKASVNVIGIGDYVGNEMSLDFTIIAGLAKIPAQYSLVDASLATPAVGVGRSQMAVLHNGNYTDFLDYGGYSALLDFGTIRHLEAIGVSPRVGLANRSRNFRIRGSNDLANWTLLHTNVLVLAEKELNVFKLNAVENGADYRYIVLDNVERLNVCEIWGFSKAMMVEATADPDPFASSGVESVNAAAGVLVKGKVTCSKEGPALVSVFVADKDFGDDYGQWNANGRRFDIGELTDGQAFQTRLAGLGAGLWRWRIFATRGGTHSASQWLPPFAVGSQTILPKAYVKQEKMAKLYDGATSYWGENYNDIWIVFDLEGEDLVQNRLVGWRMWTRSGFAGRVGESLCDSGYDPAEGAVDWDVTSWQTNGQKRVYGLVGGVPGNIVWENDGTDISKMTVEVEPAKFFVPYARKSKEKSPRYIRFRGFTNSNCAEVELRTVPYRNAATFLMLR